VTAEEKEGGTALGGEAGPPEPESQDGGLPQPDIVIADPARAVGGLLHVESRWTHSARKRRSFK
jgi:hypothetical protein